MTENKWASYHKLGRNNTQGTAKVMYMAAKRHNIQGKCLKLKGTLAHIHVKCIRSSPTRKTGRTMCEEYQHVCGRVCCKEIGAQDGKVPEIGKTFCCREQMVHEVGKRTRTALSEVLRNLKHVAFPGDWGGLSRGLRR